MAVLVHDDIAERPALADSGSDHTILSPRLADALNLDYDVNEPLELAFAGPRQEVYPTSVTLSLLPPTGEVGVSLAWEAEVVVASQWVAWFDVLLGQRGFFDLFTTTFSRHAAAFAVEAVDVFDQRFDVPPVDVGEGPQAPRLSP